MKSNRNQIEMMMDRQEFSVFVVCMTYNHANYITDAMNGFCMQQTDFPFVCVITDDASTDGEQEVIKEYVNEHFEYIDSGLTTEEETDEYLRLFARHKENKNCYFCILLLKYNHYSIKKAKTASISELNKIFKRKYTALCEGDDYWTDSLKLQKQVDFLEAHPDFSMCFHGAEVRVENSPGSEQKNGTNYSTIEDREYESTEFVSSWMVPTASIVYRKDYLTDFPIKHSEKLAFGDIVMVLKCAHRGKVFGMSDMMSVYRIQPNSMTNNPQSVESLIFRLPDHYRCLRMNFPKVEKGPLEWSISHSYYVRMKRQPNLFKKFRDFVLFVWWDPKQALGRMRKIVARKK